MPLRYDSGSVTGVQRTPQGGLRVDANITRSGVFVYRRPDGTIIREYRSPEEVSRADSLATLASAPVTLNHPPRMVDPLVYREYTRGNLHGDPRWDGKFVAGSLMIQDFDAINAVERRDTREVSCGYHCDTVDEPGVSPDGEEYDRRQVNIRYNHVALVPKGRAGRDVRLRLDSDDNQLADDPATQPQQVNTMKKVRIDGVEYEIDSPDFHQAIAKLTTERNDAIDDATQARRDADEQRALADSLSRDVVELEERLDAATAPERVAEMVNARADLISRAQAVLGTEEKLDSLTEREIQEKVLTKVDPEIRLDGESDDYVRAAFTFATKNPSGTTETDTDRARRDAAAARTGLGDRKRGERKDGEERTSRQARRDMIDGHQAEWQKPLTASKQTA